MQVLYTHDIFSRQHYGGISRYFVELIQHLSNEGSDLCVLAGKHSNQHLQVLEGHMSVMGEYSRNRQFHFLNQFRNRIQQEKQLVSTKKQIAHHTYYSFQRPLKSLRLVVTIHDMIPERFPEQFGWKARILSLAKRRSCSFADRILVVSQNTKRDLIHEFGISPDKIDVTYLGSSLRRYASQELPNPFSKPYILYVGSRGGYKNGRVLFEAFAHSTLLKNDFSLVCFGGGKFSPSEMQFFCKLGIEGHVYQRGGNDLQLSRYYKHAECFVYPSIYEGFGIPPIEAMSFDCPIVASTGGSIPEVVGSAGVYFDPQSSAMLRDSLESLLYDVQKQAELRVEMKTRLSMYSWENTAKQTLQCYEKAAA
ncbi:MAG: glycosyltransferase family 4 protein [Planctomycetaceae bacterium]|nr:glycosyltransferase family 4 protein [Planctomycetaceae bacterium]